MDELEILLKVFPENLYLRKDSGVWKVVTEDLNYVLYDQLPNENFYYFISRVIFLETVEQT